jgi:large subunit ribosomal protein L7/L12
MEQEYYKRVIQLETRMQRMEAMMQALLIRLGIDPAEVTPQDPPETRAIREALLSGNKIQAIKLYRYLYGVGLKEAKDAIDAMEGSLRG